MNMGTMALATVGEEGTKIHTDTRAFASCILAFFFFFFLDTTTPIGRLSLLILIIFYSKTPISTSLCLRVYLISLI